jgi:hypothetical protein
MDAGHPIAVKGGIGDFLQCLPFMLAHPECRYLVASHHDRVSQFFAAVGLQVDELSLGKLGDVENCPRELFFTKNPFLIRTPIFGYNRPRVVGIHLGGSSYSVSVEKRFGFPSKELPLMILEMLMTTVRGFDFILFGTLKELSHAPSHWHRLKHLRLVNNDDVTVSLSHVAECCAFIGSDSAFKTMSAMLRIPTIVWVGNYQDIFRDEKFINPYVEAGVMSLFRYSDLSVDDQVRAGVEFSLKRLREVIRA